MRVGAHAPLPRLPPHPDSSRTILAQKAMELTYTAITGQMVVALALLFGATARAGGGGANTSSGAIALSELWEDTELTRGLPHSFRIYQRFALSNGLSEQLRLYLVNPPKWKASDRPACGLYSRRRLGQRRPGPMVSAMPLFRSARGRRGKRAVPFDRRNQQHRCLCVRLPSRHRLFATPRRGSWELIPSELRWSASLAGGHLAGRAGHSVS